MYVQILKEIMVWFRIRDSYNLNVNTMDRWTVSNCFGFCHFRLWPVTLRWPIGLIGPFAFFKHWTVFTGILGNVTCCAWGRYVHVRDKTLTPWIHEYGLLFTSVECCHPNNTETNFRCSGEEKQTVKNFLPWPLKNRHNAWYPFLFMSLGTTCTSCKFIPSDTAW